MIFTSFIKNGKGYGKRLLLLYSFILAFILYFYLPFVMAMLPAQFKKSWLDSIEEKGGQAAIISALDEQAVLYDESGNEVAKVFPIEFKDGELILPKAHSVIYVEDDEGHSLQLIVDTLSDNINTTELTQEGIIFGQKSVALRTDEGKILMINYPISNLTITKKDIADGSVIDKLVPVIKKMEKDGIDINGFNENGSLSQQNVNFKAMWQSILMTVACVGAIAYFVIFVFAAFILSLFVEPFSRLFGISLDSDQSKRLSALVIIFESLLSMLLFPLIKITFVINLLLIVSLAVLFILLTKFFEKA
ncbi:MAG: hypothetical protein ACI4RJ_04085 [Alphaproteobacteria bacterium]